VQWRRPIRSATKEDLRKTLEALAVLDPVTIFHEPINIRAENVARIAAQAEKLKTRLKLEVFRDTRFLEDYALGSLEDGAASRARFGTVKKAAPRPEQGARFDMGRRIDAESNELLQMLDRWWDRISEWPKGRVKSTRL